MTLAGLVGGGIGAVLSGYPKRATALKVAMSFGLVSTTLFGMERLAYVGLSQYGPEKMSENRLLRTSHAFSGVFGGAINMGLYQGRPLVGVVMFLPIMMGVSQIEIMVQEERRRRIQQLLDERQQK
eukprot:CAMPEP_0119562072 /NCGR_PEP_ID=MMETSP1352-20130426/19440_1 /TAXON_ID=265584 /ORGANISM="Stauroneis constricta, Strain CCMP1120" /LENGTH=125 /DNA_ID=CAMNT_0007610417 /DNA_START=51 /DNA_END=428 /DNA_ORIENTATION=+